MPRDRASGTDSTSSSASPITKARSSTGFSEARAEKAAGLIINPAGYTTTSIAILDALLTLEVPVIEVHISNIHARESFRQQFLRFARSRARVICGFGIDGYALAITGLAALIGAKTDRDAQAGMPLSPKAQKVQPKTPADRS